MKVGWSISAGKKLGMGHRRIALLLRLKIDAAGERGRLALDKTDDVMVKRDSESHVVRLHSSAGRKNLENGGELIEGWAIYP
jgi:hypothetical protein